MKRRIIQRFKQWKANYGKMPLMVLGARQVGKTYSLDEFCKENYSSYIYVNLESDDDIRKIFENTLEPKTIINSIAVMRGKSINIKDTVIFLDEIQVSERAITSLKYFNEADEEYHIVCAGSMLGVALNRFKSSFPVGKVYREYMYSFDFEEFLWAIEERLLSEEIKDAFDNNKQLMEPIHQKSLALYKEYLYVGGMPASINEYVSKNKMISQYDETIKRSIIEDYLADMSKYTTNAEYMKVKKIYKSIPKQLGRDSRKFNYKLVDEKGNKRIFETSIDWLINSFIVNKCVLVELPEIPLVAFEKENFFKIYLSDVGLLAELANFTKKDIYSDEMRLFSGMLTENYVANMFSAKGIKLHYWKSKHNAEIDFLVNIDGNVLPVEVKAAGNTKSKSLNVYIEKYNPKYSIRVSTKNFGFVNKIKSVPLYAVHLIREK